MLSVLRHLGQICCFAALLTTAAAAQTPTYSLEVVAVNSIPLEGGPASHVAIAPGDTFTVKIFARDWSPDGEQVRSYQAMLDPQSYTSGSAGSIKPVDYETTTEQSLENRKHCFIDKTDPRFIHAGLETIALADSISQGYRWASVLLNADESPVAAQDGAKFYCGTVHLQASDDAQGSFTLALYENPQASGLRQPQNIAILPLDFEPLTVEVSEAARVLRILSSDPRDGAIDARRPASKRHGTPAGAWNTFELTLSGDTAGLSANGFTIEDGTSNPPCVNRVASEGSVAKLVLDRGIRAGAWTTITHNASRTHVRLGCLPGDVNNNGVANVVAVLALIHQPEAETVLPLYRTDIDRDGVTGITDVLQIIDLLTEANACRKVLRK
ncbi:MAG: hypothetical protein WBE26_16555 [Phycisphaerae bacterium]